MNKELSEYLQGLKAYGQANNIPNVTDEVGRLLNMLIQAKQPKSILEIGCANGYSTIWMAEAAKKIKATIHTVDHSAPTFKEAEDNLKEAHFDDIVAMYFGDAREVIPKMDSKLKFDFAFIDGQKASYLDFWNLVQDRLNPGAMLVFDDMLAFQHKTQSFSEAIKDIEGFDQLLIPIDENDGILLMTKHR